MAKTVEILINADDRATKKLRGIGGALGKLGGFAGKALIGGIGLATGALVGVGITALKVGDQFDQALNTIRVGTGATGSELDALGKDMRAAFRAVPDDMGLVSKALTNLNTLTGATGDTLSGLTVQVLDASRMLEEGGAANAEKFGKALSQFEIDASDAGEQLDFLFGLTQDYGVGLGQIIGMTTEYGAVLKNAGFSMAESADLMARVNAQGISWSRISPGLNAAMRKWAEGGLDIKDALGQSVEAIKNAKTETQALAIATEVFGAEGAQRLVVAIRTGAFALDDLGAGLGKASGLIGDTAADTLTLSERFSRLRNRVFDALIPLGQFAFDIIESAMPRVEAFVGRISDLAAAFASFLQTGDITKLGVTLKDIFGPETTAIILGFIETLQRELPRIRETVDKAWASLGKSWAAVTKWIGENSAIVKGILIGLGAVLIGPKVAGAITTVLRIIARIIAFLGTRLGIIGLILGLLALAWSTDFGGIATKTKELWKDSIKPALKGMRLWLETNIPIAMEKLKTAWNESLKPTLEEMRISLAETTIAHQDLATTVTTEVLPSLQEVADFILNDYIPLLRAGLNVALAMAGFQLKFWGAIWSKFVHPAIKGVWTFIKDKILPIFGSLVMAITDKLTPPLIGIVGTFNSVSSSIGGISGAVQTAITWLNNLAAAINRVRLPSWLTPGSATPFELGLRGIANEMRQLSTAELPMFQARLGALGGAVNNNYNLTINSSAPREPIIADFNMMRSLAGA